VARVQEVPREQAAAAAEFDDKTLSIPDGLEQVEDPRGTVIRVKAKPTVVDQREVWPVIGS
jgi:hypothetical protein